MFAAGITAAKTAGKPRIDSHFFKVYSLWPLYLGSHSLFPSISYIHTQLSYLVLTILAL
jgi:hypothetical protein